MYGFFRSSVSRVDAGGKKKKTRTQPQDDRGGFLVWDGKPRHSLKMTMGFSKYIGMNFRSETTKGEACFRPTGELFASD